MNIMDSKKAVTAEDLIRRYNLENLKSDRKLIQTIKENANNTNNLLNNFIDATVSDLQNLQDQVDGNIATWFFSGVPTLENLPAMDWTTAEDKNNHLGDLYYDKDTGYAYRFTLDDTTYSWMKLSDSDIAEALAIANAAQDTADSKRRVFVTQPTPPYDVGDIWIKEDTDLYRCRASRSSGNFNEVDWILATDYSNDDYAKNVEAVLNQFKTEVEANYATTVQLETTAESIEASVQSITTLTNTLSQTSALIIEDGYESDLLKFSIIGNMSLLYPSSDLYPSNDLYPLDSYLIVEHEDGTQTKIHLPLTYLNYLDETTYDEFVVENGQANIIRRVGVSEGGVLYPLETETVEYKGLLTIGIKQGYNKIWLESFYDYELEYSAKYLYQSDYTTTFAPRVEMNSSITQTKNEINLEVNEKLESYSTTQEMNSAINQTATSITQTVNAQIQGVNGEITEINGELSLKLNTDDLVSEINASADVINLQSNRFIVNSDNLQVSQDGKVTCQNINVESGVFSGEVNLKSEGEEYPVFKIYDKENPDSLYYQQTAHGIRWFSPYGSYNFFTSQSEGFHLNMRTKNGEIDPNIENTDITPTYVISPEIRQRSLESTKKDFKLFDKNALNIINNAEIYTYHLKTEKNEDKKHIGLVIPDMGGNYKTPNEVISKDNKGIDLYSMISVAWKAVQEQQEIINNLQERIKILENEKNINNK